MQPQSFPKKIRNSIIITLMCSIIVILSLLGGVIYYFTKQHLEAEMGKRLIAIAEMAVHDLPTWLLTEIQQQSNATHSMELLRSKLNRAVATGQIRRAYITDLNDALLIDTDPLTQMGQRSFEHQLYSLELNKVRLGEKTHTTLFRGNDGIYYKNGFVPIQAEGKTIAIFVVQASADFFDDLAQIRKYLLSAISAIALLIIVISILISERIIQPIHKLVSAAKRIGNGDLETPVNIAYKNEFGLLGASIDEMRRELLEKGSRMKAMLQGIAHEIRNPLGGIELFAGLLKEDLTKDQNHQLQSVLKIQEEVNNLKLTIEQFLDYARDSLPQFERTNVNEFADDILSAVKLEAGKHGIKMAVNIDQKMNDLWIDKRQMKSACVNILHNSLQAIQHDKGKISISIKDDQQDKRQVAIEIDDNGGGMAKDTLENIFRPFYTTKEKGCGLGLAFCHKIIHSHGGEIEVDSTPGKGTRMKITLPKLPDTSQLSA